MEQFPHSSKPSMDDIHRVAHPPKNLEVGEIAENGLEDGKGGRGKVHRPSFLGAKVRALAAAALVGLGGAVATDNAEAQAWNGQYQGQQGFVQAGGPNYGNGSYGRVAPPSVNDPHFWNKLGRAAVGNAIFAGLDQAERIQMAQQNQIRIESGKGFTPEASQILQASNIAFNPDIRKFYIAGTLSTDDPKAVVNLKQNTVTFSVLPAGPNAVIIESAILTAGAQGNPVIKYEQLLFGRDPQSGQLFWRQLQ